MLPAMCRVAVEAACLESARRRLRDEKGLGLRAVEERVQSLDRTKSYVSLALLGDEQQHARAAAERICPGGWALIEIFNSGAHTPLPTADDRNNLVRRTKALATAIRSRRPACGSSRPASFCWSSVTRKLSCAPLVPFPTMSPRPKDGSRTPCLMRPLLQ